METPSKEDIYWFERLDSSYDKKNTREDHENAIAHFQAKEPFPKFLLSPDSSFGDDFYRKGVWENHLKVLEKWWNRGDVQLFCGEHLADPNWPGYSVAKEILFRSLSEAIPILDVVRNNNQSDTEFLEDLEQLKVELLELEGQIKQQIIGLISEAFLKRNPAFSRRDVFINHLTPTRRSDGLFYYQVEFKIIHSDNEQNEPFGGFWSFLYDWETQTVSLMT